MHNWHTHRVMLALEALARAEGGLSAPEVADRLHANPRTARRMLYQFAEDRYLEPLPGKRHKRWIVSNGGRRLGMMLAASWSPEHPIPHDFIPKLQMQFDSPYPYRLKALRVIRERPGITAHELAKALDVSLWTVHTAVAMLDRDNLAYKYGHGYEPMRRQGPGS